MLRKAPVKKKQIKAKEFSNNCINKKPGRNSAEFWVLSVPEISEKNKLTGILACVLLPLATSFCCPATALHV